MDELMGYAAVEKSETAVDATRGASHQVKRIGELQQRFLSTVSDLEASLCDILSPAPLNDGDTVKQIVPVESPIVSSLREHGDFIEGQMDRLCRLRVRVEL
jgi:hypothetical protein